MTIKRTIRSFACGACYLEMIKGFQIFASRFKGWIAVWVVLSGFSQAAVPLVWFDASQGVVLENGKVASWTNLASPGTYDAVQSDAAKRPVVLLEEWSGQTLVYFDGVDDLLSLSGTAGNALLEGELTVFFVGRRREGGDFSPGGFLGNYHISDGSGTKGWQMGVKSGGTFQFRVGNGGNNEANGGLATLGTDFVVMAARYEDLGTGSGRMELFGTLNEDPAVRTTSSFQIESSGWDITLGSFVGFKSSGFDKFTEVDIAEIRIFGEALPDVEQQTVYEELSDKYGLTAKEFYNLESFSPEGYSAPSDSPIVLTFDVPMDPASIQNISVGENGLDGLPEQGDWQTVGGTWSASVGDTVFTFTPSAPFSAGSMILVEIPDTVMSVAGGFNETGQSEFKSFIVDTEVTHTVDVTLIDPMAIVLHDEAGDPNDPSNQHILPLELHIPDTEEPCPVMFWVHGGSFNGNNSGTDEKSAILSANMAYYFAEKLGVAVANVAWRSTNSQGSITKVNEDINTAIQYVMDHAASLGVDSSRMGLYGGSAGSPTSGLVSQLNSNISCFIGFNGSYDFVEGGYGAGSTGFGQHLPSFEANSAVDNIRANPPATLLLHGSDDTIVPAAESLKYEAALQAAGGDAETLIYLGFGHAFYNIGGNSPMHQPTLYAASRFLSRIFNLGIYPDAVPPAPAGLTATAGDGSVSLSWSDGSGDGSISYDVYRSTSPGSYGSALVTGLSTGSYDDNTASNGMVYYYVVTAVNGDGGESARSGEVFAIPALAGNLPPVFSSDPIVGTSIVVGQAYSSTIADQASDPETDPIIFTKVSGPAWLSVAADGGLSGTAPVSPGLNSFTVRVDAAGGGDTATLEITVHPDTTPPPVPVGLTATAGDGSVTLDWTNNGDGDTSTYRIYRATSTGSYTTALPADVGANSYTDSDVTNGTTYYYVVAAVDTSGNESPPSNEESAVPTEASAIVVADYSFAGSSMASFDSDPNTSAGMIADGGGLNADFETRNGRGDPQPALRWTVGDINDGTILDEDYLSFTIAPEEGVVLDFHELSFKFRFPASETDVFLYSSQNGFEGDAITSYETLGGETLLVTLDLASMASATVPIEFRLYFDTIASFGAAELWIDNIQLSATAGMSNADEDNDGIDDVWEELYFTVKEAIDGSLDSDSDGVIDFFEYLYGSIPDDASSRGFRFGAGSSESGNAMVVDWTVQTGFVLGDDYKVLVSTDLGSWEILPEGHYTLETSLDGGKAEHRLEITENYGDQVFLRLSAP